MGQKRPKLPRLPAAKSTTEQSVKFVPKEDLRLLRLAHDVSALRSVCTSAISGNSGVGERPLSADASTA